MRKALPFAIVLALGLLASAPSSSQAAVYTQPSAAATVQSNVVAPVQYWRHGPGNWGWRGRPYWYARPWGYRPYYGRVIAGVALGTIIGVAVVGAVPPRPAPDLCWYWADRYRDRGYWDYCY
jgi:hypothetical protein